ncbi:uncharacterized protein LOC143509963 isoform X2 [Brachyhypopomus gauderio]|uniref:uncharacterized protein LOC143509963 isoform X2 n=1 Tax=Brachyhypopomus gauderio TaxID=698409 RepID=UPI004042D8C2
MSFYTRCLRDLPNFTINDVHRIVRITSVSSTSKREKGFKLYVSSYIDNYEVSNKEQVTGEVSVRAICYRSMRKTEKPHSLRIVLKDSKPVILTHCQCSCVAGTVLCNHAVALLYQTAHYSQLGIHAVPPVRSCTEKEQAWHKPRTMGIKPGPVESMAIVSARHEERKVAEEEHSLQSCDWGSA